MIEQEQDILEQYNSYPVEKSKFYSLVLVLTGLYFFFFLSDMFFDLDTRSFKKIYIDWVNIFPILILPAVGFILLLTKMKIGWVILTIYFSFLSFAAIYTTIVEADSLLNISLTMRQWIILILAITVSIFLFTKSIRTFIGIRTWMCIVAVSVSSGFALLVILFG